MAMKLEGEEATRQAAKARRWQTPNLLLAITLTARYIHHLQMVMLQDRNEA
jgi:hypothetical protein